MNDELRLIRKIQKSGDRAAADTLVRNYYDEIYRFLRKQLSDHDAAYDLTQEVFISVLKSIGRYDPKRGAGFRTWLYKIATDKTVDYFRSRASRQPTTLSLDDVQPIDETDFTKRLEQQDFAERVYVFVNTLSPEAQRIFRLHIFGGYTFAEIAEQTEMPESSIKTKYYRLLNTLRKEFADHG
ncbi:MAG: RNA polymerase sigma factor [Coriobacteriia bacterium]|nr:RNA polymerase sigma factor [Coriobacteriia bacterium]